jgi:hypothetical protein
MAKKTRQTSPRRKHRKTHPAHKPNNKLNLSAIPEATDQQLRRARRVGRTATGNAKQLIAIRIAPSFYPGSAASPQNNPSPTKPSSTNSSNAPQSKVWESFGLAFPTRVQKKSTCGIWDGETGISGTESAWRQRQTLDRFRIANHPGVDRFGQHYRVFHSAWIGWLQRLVVRWTRRKSRHFRERWQSYCSFAYSALAGCEQD